MNISFIPELGVKQRVSRECRHSYKPSLSQDERTELITTLWNLVVSFVDLGFGVHPLQQADAPACGQIEGIASIFEATDEHQLDEQSKASNAPTNSPEPSKEAS